MVKKMNKSNNKSMNTLKKKVKYTKRKVKLRKSKKQHSSHKKTKKLTRRNKKQKKRKQKSESYKTSLINGGGGCGCGSNGSSSSFGNYVSNLRNTLSLNNKKGGGYSVLSDKTINQYKTVIQEYDDNNPPILL
jgi:hypothetical protein